MPGLNKTAPPTDNYLTAYGENENKNEVVFNIRTAEISFVVITAPEPENNRLYTPVLWAYLTNNSLVIIFDLCQMNDAEYETLRKGCLNFRDTSFSLQVKRWTVTSVSS